MAPGQATTTEPASELRMSLAEHLTELRKRMLRITISVLVLGGVSMVFAKEIYGLLMHPVLEALPPESAALVYTSAIEEINVYMKVGLYAGIFLTTPIILWQIWGFVSPGLYNEEKKFAGPFIIFGTMAFVAGAAFCYEGVLPKMFQFLLREESAVILEGRMNMGRLRAEDSLRFLRLGEPKKSSELAKLASTALEDSSEGEVLKGDFGASLLPKKSTEATQRLIGLGLLVDAVREGQGAEVVPRLAPVMEKRIAAVEAFGKRDFDHAIALCDEGAQMLQAASQDWSEDVGEVWKVQRLMALGQATYESQNWTRPMLGMSEQLTLVLVLELAFGVIFELPLVMMVLGMVGLVKSKWLFKYQRHAFVVCLIAAAIITPTGDAVNLALMAGPMLACYELGVILVWIVEKRRAKQTPSAPS